MLVWICRNEALETSGFNDLRPDDLRANVKAVGHGARNGRGNSDGVEPAEIARDTSIEQAARGSSVDEHVAIVPRPHNLGRCDTTSGC